MSLYKVFEELKELAKDNKVILDKIEELSQELDGTYTGLTIEPQYAVEDFEYQGYKIDLEQAKDFCTWLAGHDDAIQEQYNYYISVYCEEKGIEYDESLKD